jgi:hypothetical protein
MPARLVRAWNEAYEDHKIVGLSILAAISVMFIMAGVLVATAVFSHNQKQNCRMASAVRDAVVVVLQDAQTLVQHPPKGFRPQTSEQKDISIKFYQRNIDRLRSVHCVNK